jgi:putative endonuclease
MSRSRRALGVAGEQVAARYLEAQGMRVVARNWRAAVADVRGELDLVAVDTATLVICEVKSHRGGAAAASLEAVTPRKVAQLRRLGGLYLATERPDVREVRIDAIGVTWPRSGGPPQILHVAAVA